MKVPCCPQDVDSGLLPLTPYWRIPDRHGDAIALIASESNEVCSYARCFIRPRRTLDTRCIYQRFGSRGVDLYLMYIE